LGLDLWGKKGFLAWSRITFQKNHVAVKEVASTSSGAPDIDSGLIMSMTNILMNRSISYDGYTN